MGILDYSLAVVKNMKEDLKKIAFCTITIVQVIFLFFYGYSIYKNIERLTFLIIYIILASLSIINYVYFLFSLRSKNKKLVQVVKRIFRISKYLINGSMLGVNIYEMLHYGTTDFNKVLIIISGVSLLIQLFIELLRLFLEKYIDLFTYSLKKDLNPYFRLRKISEVKGNFYAMLDAPGEKIANKLEHKEKQLTKSEQLVEDLAEKYKKEKKEASRQRSHEKAKNEKAEIKEHLQIIKNSVFKKKSK